MTRLRAPAAAAVALALGVLAGAAPGDASQSPADVAVRLLALNDFHGNLAPPGGSNGRIGSLEAGGAEFLATHLARLGSGDPNTLVVSAGDTIGASPLLSAMFHDEPAVEALNAMGLDVTSVGNHEFDNGWRELLRIQNGGCHPADGCQDHTPFAGAAYQYLAGNVWFTPPSAPHGGTVLPGYVVKEVGGVRIGFIGLTLKTTPQLVMPAGVAGLKFESEADAANRLVPVLRRQGVEAIVVLIHEGGIPVEGNYDGCDGISGPILEIARRMSDRIDVIVSGHTHRAYRCVIGKKLVTSAASYGRIITAIDLRISTRTGDVVAKTARNVVVTRDVPKDPEQTKIIEHYLPFYDAVAHRPVGELLRDVPRAPNSAGESALGNLIADGVLEAASGAPGGPAQIALMNPGGIRADLTYGDAAAAKRIVTFAEASTVLPFRNRIVLMTLTGATIKEVLEQQFDNVGPGDDRILQVSRGFTYSYDRTAPKSRRVDPLSLAIDGQRVLPQQHYRVALNEFIATGGDNFSAFTRGTMVATIGMDLDVFIEYLQKHSPIEPGPLNRIRRTR